MADPANPRTVIPFSEAHRKPKKPFFPMTGNPEAHDYADFVRQILEGETVPLRPDEKPPT